MRSRACWTISFRCAVVSSPAPARNVGRLVAAAKCSRTALLILFKKAGAFSTLAGALVRFAEADLRDFEQTSSQVWPDELQHALSNMYCKYGFVGVPRKQLARVGDEYFIDAPCALAALTLLIEDARCRHLDRGEIACGGSGAGNAARRDMSLPGRPVWRALVPRIRQPRYRISSPTSAGEGWRFSVAHARARRPASSWRSILRSRLSWLGAAGAALAPSE